MTWSYDFDEEAWEEIVKATTPKVEEPLRCVCGRLADTRCRYCYMSTCDSSYCRAAHSRDYHSKMWMQRL